MMLIPFTDLFRYEVCDHLPFPPPHTPHEMYKVHIWQVVLILFLRRGPRHTLTSPCLWALLTEGVKLEAAGAIVTPSKNHMETGLWP